MAVQLYMLVTVLVATANSSSGVCRSGLSTEEAPDLSKYPHFCLKVVMHLQTIKESHKSAEKYIW